MSETFGVSAAFDAFKNRGRRGVLTSAAVGYVIGVVLISIAFIAAAWGSIAALGGAYYGVITAAMEGAPPSDPNDPRFMALMQALGGIAGFGLIFLFFVYLMLAMFEAAVHRWLVRGEAGGGLLGLNLGADTWRVYLCYWVWFFVYVGLSIGVSLASVIVGGGLVAALASSDPGLAGGVTAIVMVVFYLAMFYVLIRLAPATAVTIGLGRFAYFKAWTASRGRFWSMLGAYLILVVIYFAIYCLLLGVGFATALGPVIGAFAQGAPPDAQTFFAAMMQPTTLAVMGVLYLVLLAAGMVFFIAFMGINAAVARVAIAEGGLGAPPAPAAQPQPAG